MAVEDDVFVNLALESGFVEAEVHLLEADKLPGTEGFVLW
jgi:hypothetical protein